MTALYRSSLEVAHDDLREAWEREAKVLAQALRLVRPYTHRLGRIAFGSVLLLGVPAVLSGRLASASVQLSPTAVLAAIFPLAWTVGHLVRLATRTLWLRRVRTAQERNARQRQSLAVVSNPFPPLAEALAAPSLARQLLTSLRRTETAGVLLPIWGVCVWGPLALHLVAYTLTLLPSCAQGDFLSRIGAFDSWIGISLVMSGVAHLSLLVYGVWFVRQLKRRLPESMPSGFRPVYVVTAASTCPGIMLVPLMGLGFLPLAITFATGAVLLPWVFGRAQRLFFAERYLVGEVEGDLPGALQPRISPAV